MFALLEWWGLPYQDAMRIPWSRRQRLIQEKSALEKRRAAARESVAARGRGRRGR